MAPYFSDFTTTPTLITYAYIERELHEYYKETLSALLPGLRKHGSSENVGR
jgi:hypothetical protein